MYGKKVKLRIIFISSVFITLILSVYIILKLLDDNIVYFKSPTEIKQLSEIDKKKIRVGGMVKNDSILIKSEELEFILSLIHI